MQHMQHRGMKAAADGHVSWLGMAFFSDKYCVGPGRHCGWAAACAACA